MDDKRLRIRELNDAFRKSFIGGKVMLTQGVQELAEGELKALLESIQSADSFNAENDPYKEHDFGSVDQAGERYYWKIDYYDPTLQGSSEDPSDPTKTCRVLTIMHADEY
jgi:hypothetical protein